MKTRNLHNAIFSLVAVSMFAATNSSYASTVFAGTLTPFTGGDAGEGLDLSGEIVYAFNLGGPALSIQGVNFASADASSPPAGVAIVGDTTSQFDYSSINPDGANGAVYGSSSNDVALGTMMNTVWFSSNLTLELAVVPGTQYQLQLLLQEAYFLYQGDTFRNFDISVETSSPDTLTSAVVGLNLGQETNGANSPGDDSGLVYTFNFTATDSSFRFSLDDSPLGADSNAVLQGIVLTQVPEPSGFALLGLSSIAALARRRR